jgi:tetratricopeptide (TPR) repeat protein
MANIRAARATAAMTAAAMCAVIGLAGGIGLAQELARPQPTTAKATAPAWPASPAPSSAVMLEKGIYTEETLGDLDAAMKIYRQIVEDAKANRRYAAQAQYRLGMCYLKKGDKAKARDTLDELIRQFPDQKDLIAQARKQIPSELKLIAAPWADGEQMTLAIYSKTGMEVGTIIYTAELLDRRPNEAAKPDEPAARAAPEGADKQKKYWRIESFMTVPVGNMEQFTRVEAEADSFAPIFGRTKNNIMGDCQATYMLGKVKLDIDRQGKETTQQADLAGPVFDNEQAIYLIRRMPLAEGYEGTFQIFPVTSGSVCECRIRVEGKEKRSWTAGEIDTFRVNLQVCYGGVITLQNKIWFSADENRWLVDYDAGTAEMKLVSVGKLPKQAQIFRAAPGVTLTRPGGWHYYVNPVPGEYRLLVSMMPPEFKAYAVMAAVQMPTGVTFARPVAEGDVKVMKSLFKDYAVRPNTWIDLKVGDLPAVSYLADFTQDGKALVDYRTYVASDGSVYWFVFRIEKDKFQAERNQFDSIVQSLKLTAPAAPTAVAGAPGQLPPEVMGYIIGEHYKAQAKAQEKSVRVNTHIYGVDGKYNLYSGGFMDYTNQSDKPEPGPICLSNFGKDKPDFLLTDETGQPQKYELRDRGTDALGRYALWWSPDKPVLPGAKRLLGYLSKKTKPLPQVAGQAALTMQNTFGAAVMENFFLVVPHGMTAAKPSDEPTSKQTVGEFDIYLWQKQVPPNTRHEVTVGLKAPQDTTGGAGSTELARDDGTSAGMRSIAGAAQGVKFLAPAGGAKLTGVRIYGSRYGMPQPPAENFRVWVTNSDNKRIAEFSLPYSKFERGQPAWVDLPVQPTAVPKEFFLFVDFNAERTKGVYVHYDAAADGNSFTADRNGKATPFRDGDWMIRAVVTCPGPATGTAEAEALKGKLITWVEKFFSENYRDITARKTLQWGEPETTAAGNLAIRYKYLATIWDKDQQIIEQRFTFTPEGKYVSGETIEKSPATPEVIAQLARQLEQIVVEDLAIQILAAIRDKDDAALKALATNRIKDWPGALPKFALEMRERFRQKTGKPFQMSAGQSMVLGSAAVVKCTGPVELDGVYLALFFVKTADGWKNFSLRNSPASGSLETLLRNAAKEIGLTDLPNSAEAVTTVPSDADKKAAENLSAEGWRLWGQRKLPEAEAKFQSAVEKDPTNANAWNGLGWARMNQGKTLNAKEAFEMALVADPKLAGALNGLGWIAKGQGKTEDAIEYWKKAIAASPAATAALSGLASTYADLGEYGKAIDAYQQWLKVEPENKDAKAGLKKAQDAAEAVKAAVPAAEQWLKLVDDGKYGECWDAAAEFLRKAVGKDVFEKQIAAARKPLGKLQSRMVKLAVFMTSLPGAPDGQYVIIQFEAVFENKKQAVETVTPMKDKDGKWRVSGYYVK